MYIHVNKISGKNVMAILRKEKWKTQSNSIKENERPPSPKYTETQISLQMSSNKLELDGLFLSYVRFSRSWE